jgi:excisionase family DNA binding protein
MQDHNTPLMFTIPGATQATGLPRTTIYDLISKGLLDARKAGRRTLLTADSIQAYLATLPSAKIGNQRAA